MRCVPGRRSRDCVDVDAPGWSVVGRGGEVCWEEGAECGGWDGGGLNCEYASWGEESAELKC